MYCEIYKLASELEESVNDDIFYHGGNIIEDFSKLVYDRDRSMDLNAEGPGLYFTNDLDEASVYGEVVYKTKLIPGLKVIKESDKPTLSILKKFLSYSSNEDKEMFLSNWGENPNINEVLANYINDNSLIEAFILLYHDLLSYSSSKYINIMIKLGYDGYLIDKGDRKHLVVYNVSKFDIEQA